MQSARANICTNHLKSRPVGAWGRLFSDRSGTQSPLWIPASGRIAQRCRRLGRPHLPKEPSEKPRAPLRPHCPATSGLDVTPPYLAAVRCVHGGRRRGATRRLLVRRMRGGACGGSRGWPRAPRARVKNSSSFKLGPVTLEPSSSVPARSQSAKGRRKARGAGPMVVFYSDHDIRSHWQPDSDPGSGSPA